MPAPPIDADDASLVGASASGDATSWVVLKGRYDAIVRATAMRSHDRGTDADELIELVWARVRGSIAQWNGECQLRSLLAVLARHAALELAQAAARPIQPLPAIPTPRGVHLDDLFPPASRVEQTLERLPPNLEAMVRLRLRELTKGEIAAALGMSPASVRANLERVATRLGQLDRTCDTTLAWRVLLDTADAGERVDLAVRTEDDAPFRSARATVEKAWRVVGQRAQPAPRAPQCLDDLAQAGFVDGTLRGAARARAEGHVASCTHCLDECAELVIDLRAQSILRDAIDLPSTLAAAAACIAANRFEAAEQLTRHAIAQGLEPQTIVRDLRRLVQTGQLLESGRATPAQEQTSQVVRTSITGEDEAPLVAFEALALDDPRTAWRAIDDRSARSSLGARLRLLAAASGLDLDVARSIVDAAADQPPIDPSHQRDVQTVAALPRGRALPHEIRVDRLRAMLPEAVRFGLTRE
jgi:DNA-directed RNA polymerase specialized sigma24 family protein